MPRYSCICDMQELLCMIADQYRLHLETLKQNLTQYMKCAFIFTGTDVIWRLHPLLSVPFSNAEYEI